MKTPLVLAAVAAAALVAGLAGCTPDSASSSTTSSPKAVTELDWDVHYAKCMRSKGNDFPDPGQGDKSRQLVIGENKTEETYDADLASCTSKVEADYGKRPISKADEKEVAEADANQDCLRKNGVDVPDQSGGAAPAMQLGDVPKDVLEKCGYGEAAGE